jgi:light-regulated signal transduction histidine kinase (bacteriophytochrome)
VRRWSDPVPLPRVIRAASAEIEDYNRVGVMPMADVRVVGHGASDVVHLLAELIENAAAFSPPGTRVQVSGEWAGHGHLLEIEDQGIGMSDEELAEAKEQLAKPASIDLAGQGVDGRVRPIRRRSAQAGSARPACSMAASIRSTGPSMALAAARAARRSRSGGWGSLIR